MANLWNEVTNRVMRVAEEEARRFHHEYIGSEHVLMALLRLHGCAAAKALAARGIDLRHVRLEVEKALPFGPDRPRLPRILPLTPRARQALRNAVEAADALGKGDVDTGHLLLGLVREEEGLASQVLYRLGVVGSAGSLEQLRDEVGHHAEAIQTEPTSQPVRTAVEDVEHDVPASPPVGLSVATLRATLAPHSQRGPARAVAIASVVGLILLLLGWLCLWVGRTTEGIVLLVFLAIWVTLLVAADAVRRRRQQENDRRLLLDLLPTEKFAMQRNALEQAIESRFGKLDDAARQRLQTWDPDRLARASKQLPDAKSLGDLGLDD